MPPVEPDVNPSVSDTPPPAEAASKPAKPSLMARFKTLMLEYGPLAIAVNYVIFGLVVVGFYAAIQEIGFPLHTQLQPMVFQRVANAKPVPRGILPVPPTL